MTFTLSLQSSADQRKTVKLPVIGELAAKQAGGSDIKPAARILPMTYCFRCGIPRAASGACCGTCGARLMRPVQAAKPVRAQRNAPIPFPTPAHERGKGLRGFLFLVLSRLIRMIGIG